MTDNRRLISSKSKGKTSALILGIVLLGALVTGALVKGGLFNESGSSASQPVSSQSEKQHEEKIVLACPGRIEGVSEAIGVGAGADGVLTEVRVREGQQVKADQVLAVINCSDWEAELQSVRAIAESLRQMRQRLVRGSREEERRVAHNEKMRAEAIVKQAQLRDERFATLFSSGVTSKEDFEQARRDKEIAEANLQASENRLALVNASPLPEELAKADAEINAAEGRIESLSAKLRKCSVRAPINGTVLRTHMKVGESVSTVYPQPVVSIADISQLCVRAEVDERDVRRVHLGQKVSVWAEGTSGKTFVGTVSRISAQMGRKKVRTGDPAEKSDRDVLEVLVNLAETEEWMVTGLRVTVRFLEKEARR